ncbi:MAG: thioredoxin [Candidatus Thermoplasmatota archaeon]
MDKELEKIKKKKLEQMKKKYIKGENMNEKMPNEPIKMSDADIDQHVEKYDKVVVDCWAPWCGPCKTIGPIIEDLAEEMQGEFVFGKLNVDENKQTASKYGIMSIPSLLIFKNGELVDKMVGAMPKENIKSKLQKY